MRTEAEQTKAVAALQGALRRVWDFLRLHHFRTMDDIVIGAKLQPAEARAAVSSLVKAGLIEAQTAKKGEVYRPAPCAVDAKEAPPRKAERPETVWTENELRAALSDPGNPLHESAKALLASVSAPGSDSDKAEG